MKINSILIAANNYPTKSDPVFTFLEQIVEALSKQGIRVTVIAPYRILQHYLRKTALHPRNRVYSVDGAEMINIIQPRYITLGGRFEKFNMWSARKSVCRQANKLKQKPDVCYGYFWHWAWALFPYAKNNNIPLIVHTGETPIILHKYFRIKKLGPFLEYVSGVVCNSSFCKKLSIEASLASEDKCEIFPNAINNGLFYPRDRVFLRRNKGLEKDVFVIIYVGWFNENKGSLRVAEAITKLNDPEIKSVFVGEGQNGDSSYDPNCDGLFFRGRLPHSEIPEWLGMADVFVFPTQHEGSSNVIIEAMACGLPIISSDRMFNWDVLNEKNSIMIDPMNVDEIASAIKKLKDDKEKRVAMSKAALETAAGLTVDKRVGRILSFVESKIIVKVI